jgi:transcriptional regulator with XRE-family HTH domain
LSRRQTEVRYFDDARAVGRRVREARERAGLSQRELAFSGCSPAYLSRIESGERTPSLQLLRELARRLKVSDEYLAYGKEAGLTSDPLFEAELALRMDEREEAERLFREALAGADDDQARRGAALEGLGELAFRVGQEGEAIELLEQALALFGEAGLERRALVDTLGRALAFSGAVEAAVALYERALQAAEAREDAVGAMLLRIVLSAALSDAGRLRDAEKVLTQALVHADELSDPQARVRLYWAQCRLHLLKGRADLAERYGLRVLELVRASEDAYHLGLGYRLMARIKLDQGEPHEALELLERAREAVAASANEAEEATIRLNEARAYALLGERERAAAMAMEAAGALAGRPDEAGQSFSLLAQTFAEAGERARAIELYELAAQFLERSPNRYLVEAYAGLGELLEAEGRTQDALEVMKKALRLKAQVGVV